MLTFNEEKIVKNIINNNEKYFEFNLQDLKMIAKYLYKQRSYNEKDMLRDDLKSFLNKKLYLYNENKYDEYIDICSKYCLEYQLMGREPIALTCRELKLLLEIEDYEARRLMFIMLMFSKNCVVNHIKINNDRSNDKLYFAGSSKEIFKLANVKYTLDNSIRVKMILQELELVDYGYGDWCEILFYDENDNDIEIEFMPDDSIINYIIGFEDKHKSLVCRQCGEWFSVSSKNNKTKLCHSCSKKNNKQQVNERVKKHRNNNKNIDPQM